MLYWVVDSTGDRHRADTGLWWPGASGQGYPLNMENGRAKLFTTLLN